MHAGLTAWTNSPPWASSQLMASGAKVMATDFDKAQLQEMQGAAKGLHVFPVLPKSPLPA